MRLNISKFYKIYVSVQILSLFKKFQLNIKKIMPFDQFQYAFANFLILRNAYLFSG